MTELFKEVTNVCPNFTMLPDEQKFMYLVSAEGEIIKAVAKFCHLAFERHNYVPRTNQCCMSAVVPWFRFLLLFLVNYQMDFQLSVFIYLLYKVLWQY